MHVRLLLPTLEAVLVAFQRYPHALTQLVDDVETAYGAFGCASPRVSALERSDELGLIRTRVGLVEMLACCLAASDVSSRGSAHHLRGMAEGAAERLETPVPELPADSCARSEAETGPARAEQIGAQHVHVAHAR